MPPRYEFIRANGIQFRVWSAGEGDKLALCLHGFPEFSHSWRYQMPLLEKLGYRVWAPDLKGFGGSDAPTEVGNYRMDRLVEDIAALVDASGAKSLTLFGHDWGAFIAWNFAIQKKRPLEKLVILNVPHPGAARRSFRDSKTGRPNWKQLRRSSYMFFFQIPWLPEKLATAGHAALLGKALRDMIPDKTLLTDEDLKKYRNNICLPGHITPMLNYYRAMIRYDLAKQSREKLPLIETPTLFLWGEKDVALGKELTYGTDRYVKDLTLRYLPGVSHLAQQHAPNLVNPMIEAFLANHPVPEARDIQGVVASSPSPELREGL